MAASPAVTLASFNPNLYEECLLLLVEARKAAGISQVQLAEQIGRRQTFVSKIELRERRLDPAEFILIGRAIGTDPLELLRKAEECLKPGFRSFVEQQAIDVRLPLVR